MISDLIIEEVYADQLQLLKKKDKGILREIFYESLIKSTQIVVVTGIRRCGKSTLLHQLTGYYNDFAYINFDDERLYNFALDDFQKLMLIIKKRGDTKNIFIDEIQNVAGWERFTRRIHDEGYKIFITGSNSKLLSSELATHLTGRYTKTELYPFSFNEYIKWLKINPDDPASDTKAQLLAAFDAYLINGGFPGYLQNMEGDYLRNIYEDIIQKDLIVRFGIKNVKSLKVLAHYLYSNFTKEISYNTLKNVLNLKSVNTVKDYIDYLQQAYMVFECYKYDYSLKKQEIYNKKCFVIDNGLRMSVAFKFNADMGQLLENLVYIELRRQYESVYFYKTKENYEVDFYVDSRQPILIQVCLTTEDAHTRIREVRSLTKAMNELQLSESYLLTYNEENTLATDRGTIHIMPVWRWLMKSKQIMKI